VVSDLPSALNAVPQGEDEAFIMGGGQLYAESIKQADKIYLSELSEDIEGDITFPEFSDNDFEVVSTEGFPDASIPYTHRVFKRR
jgi:dihydrofolate reductase